MRRSRLNERDVLRPRLVAADPGDRRRRRLARELVLTAADGNEFAAFLATPEEPAAAGVVILPDVRGLYRFYEELALRFAERGYRRASRSTTSAAPPEPRSATTTSSTCRTSSRRPTRPCRPTRAPRSRSCASSVHLDLHRRLLLRRPRVVGRRRVGPRARRRGRLLRLARRASAAGRAPSQRVARDRRARSSRCRPATTRTSPPRTTPRSTQALTDAGVEHEIVTYDGAPHSFFDRKQEEFADASDDAWRRMLAFVEHAS